MTKLALFLAACLFLSAQQPATPSVLPIYDAVTIKLSDPSARGTHVDDDDATFQARNVTLKHLLVNAYGIREGLIFNLPKWAGSTRFDINAKVTEPDLKLLHNLTREQRQPMIAAILADRFHLRVHFESKTLPVYELVVGKGGSKLTPTAVPDANGNSGNLNVQNSDMTATALSLSELAGNLSYPLDRTVIDKTGLTGRYDFHLKWTPDNAIADSAPPDAPPVLITAIQEQLGLKLQPAKGPVQTLVIDRVEQPTAN